MPLRFTITQLLMAVALIGIGLLFLQSEGCGSTYHRITQIEFSPDGKQLAVVHYSYRNANVSFKAYAADVTRVVELLSLETGHTKTLDECHLPGNHGPFHTIVGGPEVGFSASQNCVAVVLQSLATVRLFDLPSGKQTEFHPQIVEPLSALQFSSDGEMLVLGEGDQLLSRWNVATLQPASRRVVHDVSLYWRFQPSGLSVGPGAETAILCDGFQSSRVDFATGKESKLAVGSEDVSFAAISADGKSILVVKRSDLFLYDLAVDRWTRLKLDVENSGCLAASPHFKHILAVSNGSELRSSVRILSIGSANVQTTILQHGWGQAAAFSRDGTRVAVGIGSKIDVWDTATHKLVASYNVKPRHRLPCTLPLTAFAVWCLIVFWLRRS